MRFKPGVRARGIRAELLLALVVADQVYADLGHQLTVTSLVDGKHSETSLHYVGCAADLRTHGAPAAEIVTDLRKRLEPLGDYDVVLGGKGTPNEHIHLEYQPKARAGTL